MTLAEVTQSFPIDSEMRGQGEVEPHRSRRIAETIPRRKHASVISINLVSDLVFLSRTMPYYT